MVRSYSETSALCIGVLMILSAFVVVALFPAATAHGAAHAPITINGLQF